MNIRSNKGFTGIDISVSIIIILILIPTIFGIVYNMQKTRVKTERQAEAIDIATDILETAKSTDFNEISTYYNLGNMDISTELIKSINEKIGYTIKQPSEEIAVFSYEGKNGVHYKVEIGVQKLPDENAEDLLKEIMVKVTYPIGNEFKSIDISTLIQNR